MHLVATIHTHTTSTCSSYLVQFTKVIYPLRYKAKMIIYLSATIRSIESSHSSRSSEI